jgi:hypothetical protein
MKLPAVSIGISVLTDGLTRRLAYFRPKERGINPINIKLSGTSWHLPVS